MTKGEILQEVIAHFEDTIANFSVSMDEHKQQYDLDETETTDPEDMSHQTVSRDMEMRLQLQADEARNNLALVKEFAGKDLNSVEYGALLETDKKWFLVGVSAPVQVLKSGKQLVSFSTEAPVYSKLEGLKEGESFELGNEKYKIKKVY